MNRNQQVAIAVGASVILLMLIFPPFHVQIRDTTFNMGYAFIFDPPKRGYITASVNVGMLLVQWVGTLLLTGLAFFMLKSSDKSRKAHDAPIPSYPIEPRPEEGAHGTELKTPNSTLSKTTEIPQQNESAIDSASSDASIDQAKTFLGGIHHPWRRFFARTVDLLTLGMLILLLLSFLVGYLFPQNVESFVKALENPITAGIILYLFWLPAEAALIATTGTTPAKWIFGISVLAVGSKKLSYSAALKRAFLVWIQGEGFGIPFVTLFTRLFAYRRLTKTGTTLWDTSVGSVVTHKKWGVVRATASVFAVLLAMMIIGILNSMGNK